MKREIKFPDKLQLQNPQTPNQVQKASKTKSRKEEAPRTQEEGERQGVRKKPKQRQVSKFLISSEKWASSEHETHNFFKRQQSDY